MSNQDSGFPLSNNGAPSDSMAGSMVPLQQSPAMPAVPAMGGGYAPVGPEILHGPLNQTWLMNCLRRRWLLALLMGLLIGVITAGGLLFAIPQASSITAYLRVKSRAPKTLGKPEQSSIKDYALFAQTQLVLIKGHNVLRKALGRTDIAQLDAVREEGSLDDQVQWLTDELRVSYPGEGEILEVRLSGDEDPGELAKVVNAVLDAFEGEVLQKELTARDGERGALKTMHAELAKEIEEKMTQYEKLAEAHGDNESESSITEVKMLTHAMGMILKEQIANKRERLDIEVMKSLAIRQARSPSALDARVQEEVATDLTIQNYENDLYQIDQQVRALMAGSRRETSKTKQLKASRRQLEQEMEQYRMTAENKIRQRRKRDPNEMLAGTMIEYNQRKKYLDAQTIELQNDYDEKFKKVLALGKGSTILAIRKSEIEGMQETEREINAQLRSWVVEDKTAGVRISVAERATILPASYWQRYIIAGLGGLLAFCSICYGVALMEFQRRRLNQPSDVEEGLGIRVLGALPVVASRKALAAGSPIAAQVSESIDNVRATLLHDSTTKERQVILVTSPVTMEGSTTVASHLAVSLSRAGRRTLLIDGDLREPSLHKLFNLPLDGGFSEVLRSEIDVVDAVRPTTTEGLWLLTAGLCDMDTIHALATDQPQPIFEKLRAEFDFVIIDGAPILGLSDMLSLGQHVDGAILTVLRDHSEMRKVHQAAELLKNMGIRLIGSVVNGIPQKADRRITKLHQAAAKRTPKLPAAAATTVEA